MASRAEPIDGPVTPESDAAAPTNPRTALVVYNGEAPDGERGETMPQPDGSPKQTLAYGDDPDAAATTTTTATSEVEGRPFGDFLIRRLIGEGGMGKVYEAEERLSRRRVALKVLRGELARSASGRRAFVNEMGILARLDNPYVVRCLHCTEVDGDLVMALEFLEGQTLREHMHRRGALPWDEVVAIAWQIAAALEAAHAGDEPIIHRDLKPENVMLLDGGAVKVMDFGIAKIVQAATGNTTHSVGTLQYMSPEQIDARPLTPRSDLYALGLVMWELLAGRPPFESESPRVLLDKLCTEPAPTLPAEARRGLPRGVEQLIHALLEKDADDRPASASVVLERLEPFRPAELSTAATASGSASASAPAQALRTDSPDRASDRASAQSDAQSSVQSSAQSAARPSVGPRNLDTVALVDSAAEPREVSTTIAVAIIVGLSVVAGLVTYLIRLAS